MVFIRRNLLHYQLNNIPESLLIFHSKQIILRGIGGNLYHLVYSVNVTPNSNHIDLHATGLQCIGFWYGQVPFDV